MLYYVLGSLSPFVALYAAIFLASEKGSYAMDPSELGHKTAGTFESHLKNYLEVSKAIITLLTASISAIALFLTKGDGSIQPQAMALPLIIFATTLMYGVSFAGFLTWRYERYCHFPDSYTRPWRALIYSLGCCMLFGLASGYVALVYIILTVCP